MELDVIRKVDPDVAEAIEKELHRQQNTIELIASENFTSPAVMAACGSVLTNKYAEGKPHKRFYNGCENVDLIEELAQKSLELHQRAKKIVKMHQRELDHALADGSTTAANKIRKQIDPCGICLDAKVF